MLEKRTLGFTDAIARTVESTKSDQIPSLARSVAKLSLLDWMAVAAAGSGEAVSRIVADMAVQDGGDGQAHIVGRKGKVPARSAALVNGVTSHALDYDDTHFAHIGHPSVAVIPCALAVAEKLERSGTEFLEAALIGMEVSVRVGIWLGREHYEAGFHQTATAGAFGAAASAARLMNLDAANIAATLGLASTRASGLKSQFGTMGKPLNAGIAAANGVEAATLVAMGFAARSDGMECHQGFLDTHAGSGDVSSALDGIGEDWLMGSVSHKYHACCHGLHAALEAMRKLDENQIRHIDGICVRTHPRWLSVCNIAAPKTGLEAKFSYRQVLAMLAHGYDTANPASYDADTCNQPDLLKLRGQIEITGDESLSETEALLTVTLQNGEVLELAHELLTETPLAERTERLRSKAISLIGETRAAEFWEIVECEKSPESLGQALANI